MKNNLFSRVLENSSFLIPMAPIIDAAQLQCPIIALTLKSKKTQAQEEG